MDGWMDGWMDIHIQLQYLRSKVHLARKIIALPGHQENHRACLGKLFIKNYIILLNIVSK